jgi:thiol-disulfide isomerase/thioredoxin
MNIMNKKTALILAILLFTVAGFSQSIIVNNPKTGFNSSTEIHLTKVELTNTETSLSFRTTGKPGSSISIPKETYIQVVDSAEKLFVKSVEGAVLEESSIIPASGALNYKLIFPKIDLKTKAIDYGEAKEDGGWFIYNIQLQKQAVSRIPEELSGHWFNVETNELELCLYDEFVFYKNKSWFCNSAKIINGNGVINLSNKTETLDLTISDLKNDSGLFGISPDNRIRYSKNQKNRSTQKPENDQPFGLPLFSSDSATYSGLIIGFTPRMGVKNIEITVEDIITGGSNLYYARVANDGGFSIKIPVYYPHNVSVKSTVFDETVFLEPGKSLFQLFGTGNSNCFMGESAKINAELAQVGNLVSDSNPFDDKILETSVTVVKNHTLTCLKNDLNTLDSIFKNTSLSTKTYQILKSDLVFGYHSSLLEKKMLYDYYYKKNYKNTESKPEKLDYNSSQYYDFISNEINNPIAITSNNYGSFIGNMGSIELLNEMDITKSDSVKNERKTLYRIELLKKLFGVEKGGATDLFTAEFVCKNLVFASKPLSDQELEKAKPLIANPFIFKHIVDCNEQVKITSKNTGYVINETPKVDSELLLDSIIARYKGKVIFLDFWATWCSPCRAGIKQMKQLKEGMTGKNIVFVYITGETSPLKTWSELIPNIKGEHYRLSEKEWRFLCTKYNIPSIPRYMIVDKTGKIINLDYPHTSNDVLEQDLEKLLQK